MNATYNVAGEHLLAFYVCSLARLFTHSLATEDTVQASFCRWAPLATRYTRALGDLEATKGCQGLEARPILSKIRGEKKGREGKGGKTLVESWTLNLKSSATAKLRRVRRWENGDWC